MHEAAPVPVLVKRLPHGEGLALPGYATAGPGIYDYKKSLRPLQRYDWRSQGWLDLAPEAGTP